MTKKPTTKPTDEDIKELAYPTQPLLPVKDERSKKMSNRLRKSYSVDRHPNNSLSLVTLTWQDDKILSITKSQPNVEQLILSQIKTLIENEARATCKLPKELD